MHTPKFTGKTSFQNWKRWQVLHELLNVMPCSVPDLVLEGTKTAISEVAHRFALAPVALPGSIKLKSGLLRPYPCLLTAVSINHCHDSVAIRGV